MLRNTAQVARRLTNGQQAAARHARTRRGDLGLSQTELAKRTLVSRRTIVEFEAERTWPNPDTLARLERHGLGWPVGYLNEYAHKHGEREPSTLDADIAAIMDSNLHNDLKLRLIDRLRSTATQKIRDELPDIEQIITGTDDPGEGHTEGREIA